MSIVLSLSDHVELREDSEELQSVERRFINYSVPPDDNVMDIYSPISVYKPSEEYETQFSDLPVEILGNLALYMNREDIKNFALATKCIYLFTKFAIMLNIRRFCSVIGDSVFPVLTLTTPPGEQCVESIIASNGHLHIQKLDMLLVSMTLDDAHLIASIVQNTKLSSLILFHCGLTDKMIVAISEGLSQSNLMTLDLRGNKIGDAGACAIGRLLHGSMLTTLNLGHNSIGPVGARSIAEGLQESNLTSLHLPSNQIGADGARAIQRALPGSMLTSLDVSGNKIGGDGAVAIGRVLSISMLTSPKLDWNLIGDGDAGTIAAALLESKLTALHVNTNGLTL